MNRFRVQRAREAPSREVLARSRKAADEMDGFSFSTCCAAPRPREHIALRVKAQWRDEGVPRLDLLGSSSAPVHRDAGRTNRSISAVRSSGASLPASRGLKANGATRAFPNWNRWRVLPGRRYSFSPRKGRGGPGWRSGRPPLRPPSGGDGPRDRRGQEFLPPPLAGPRLPDGVSASMKSPKMPGGTGARAPTTAGLPGRLRMARVPVKAIKAPPLGREGEADGMELQSAARRRSPRAGHKPVARDPGGRKAPSDARELVAASGHGGVPAGRLRLARQHPRHW